MSFALASGIVFSFNPNILNVVGACLMTQQMLFSLQFLPKFLYKVHCLPSNLKGEICGLH